MKIQDLSAWENFYWVAKEGSFTKAAKRQKIALPVVSRRLAWLENQLGVRLLTRTTRKVSLTEEGRIALPRVQGLLEDAQGVEDLFDSKETLSGSIRLACVTAFAHRVLGAWIIEFRRLHPQVRFEVEVTDNELDLLDHQLDLAIRVQEPRGADWVFKKLLTNHLVVCASPEYTKRKPAPIRKPEDLASHSILSLRLYENCRFQGSKVRLGDFTSARNVLCENGLFLTRLALQGEGVAIRSRWDVEAYLKDGELQEFLPKFPLEPFGNMYLVVPSRRLMARRIRVFVDFLETQVKRRNWK